MRVKDLINWLAKLPQDEDVKYSGRFSGMITLKIHDPDDPHDDYESDLIDEK